MKSHMSADGTWKYILNKDEPDVNGKKTKAWADLTASLEQSQIMTVVQYETPYEVWLALEQAHRAGSAQNITFLIHFDFGW